ncbi:MAG: toll/interleukin-1 receptor domain-containing protein, partial [Acidimicrobiales bacterium]
MTDATIGRAGEPGPDVFVSFNSDDRVFAGQLTDGLHRRGLDAWFDEDQIEPGEIWRNEVVPGLLRAGAAVIIVSDDGLGPVQAEEILLLLDRRTREPDFRLVPVVLGDVDQRRDEPLVAQLLVMSIVNVSGSIDDGVVDTIANRVLGVHDVDLPSTLGECPYPGLSSFQADVHDAARFHGREKELDEIRAHLGTSQVVCVLGPSGVGKSSLALAGLEKLRRENRFGEAADVEIAAIEPGSYPMDAVRRQLAPGELTIDLDDPGADELRRRLHLAGVRPTLILVVDQLEAIFAPSADPEQRDRFIDTLVHAMRNPLDGRYLVLTMRSDMLDRAYDHPGLGSAIADFEFTLGPMSRDGLQKAVQQPAWDAGARFAPGVAATIVDEIADQPNALPLMALGLQKMWPHASGDTLTIESYRRGGGVRKALDQLGDSTIEPFEQADEPLVRWLLLRLVELNDGQRATSRICPESELEPSDPSKHDLARRTVRALLNERILVSGNTAKGATVSFVHDAVVSSWGTLREWIDEAKRLDPRLEELREAAAEWDSSDRPRDLLLSRRRLRILGEDELTTRSILGQVDRDFLDASRGRQRLFTAAAAGLALVMMVAIGGGAFGLLRADSERQAREVGDTLRLAT